MNDHLLIFRWNASSLLLNPLSFDKSIQTIRMGYSKRDSERDCRNLKLLRNQLLTFSQIIKNYPNLNTPKATIKFMKNAIVSFNNTVDFFDCNKLGSAPPSPSTKKLCEFCKFHISMVDCKIGRKSAKLTFIGTLGMLSGILSTTFDEFLPSVDLADFCFRERSKSKDNASRTEVSIALSRGNLTMAAFSKCAVYFCDVVEMREKKGLWFIKEIIYLRLFLRQRVTTLNIEKPQHLCQRTTS